MGDMKAERLLMEAAALVGGARATKHGDMVDTMSRVARLWNGYLLEHRGDLLASDVANMMELLKIARRGGGKLNKDDFLDGAGYAAVAWACASHEELWRGIEESDDAAADDDDDDAADDDDENVSVGDDPHAP
tara:strand:+ start:178 stop:576 length:399 start_codon:yes stop_codon:yes gene_type:complete